MNFNTCVKALVCSLSIVGSQGLSAMEQENVKQKESNYFAAAVGLFASAFTAADCFNGYSYYESTGLPSFWTFIAPIIAAVGAVKTADAAISENNPSSRALVGAAGVALSHALIPKQPFIGAIGLIASTAYFYPNLFKALNKKNLTKDTKLAAGMTIAGLGLGAGLLGREAFWSGSAFNGASMMASGIGALAAGVGYSLKS